MDAAGDSFEAAFLTLASQRASFTIAFFEKVFDKFSASVCRKFLKNASQEEKDSFMKKLKDAHLEKLGDCLTQRIEFFINKSLIDHSFIEGCNEIMGKFKSIEELRQDNEIAKNHLQSVENEYTILERDTDKAIDKLEAICMEHVCGTQHLD